jgi:ubiquinone/menaquinone biosynthesis C-methylase UbiE
VGAIPESRLQSAVAATASTCGAALGVTATSFLTSVYAHGLDRYRRRLESVGLASGEYLLDAGCGFGQWSLAASASFEQVVGVDNAASRVEVCRRLASDFGAGNCEFLEARLEKLPFGDGQFDAAVSYSVLYLTDYVRAIVELGRVLRPGALLYLNTNHIGRYLADIIRNRYANADFNSRRYGLAAIARTMVESSIGNRVSGRSVAMSPRATTAALGKAGFEIVAIGPEGSLGQGDEAWQPGRYAGFTAAYDVLARRR